MTTTSIPHVSNGRPFAVPRGLVATPASSRSLDERYALIPHMRVYDTALPVLAPYLTTMSPAQVRTPVLNTDRYGFRISHGADGLIESDAWWSQSRRGLILGGSLTFGVGATHDRYTMASRLSALTGTAFLSLGVRAENSTQELISAIPFLAHADVVIVCSGMNNLVMVLQSIGENELSGPLFDEEQLQPLRRVPIQELASAVTGSADRLLARTLVTQLLRRSATKLHASWPHRSAESTTPGARLKKRRVQRRLPGAPSCGTRGICGSSCMPCAQRRR